MNLIMMLGMNARKCGSKEALRYRGNSVSFAELKNKADAAAGLFRQWGIGRGDKVSIMSLNTPSFVVAFYGVLGAGGTVVPINHKLVAPEVEYIVDHSESKVLLFDGALVSTVGQVVAQVRKVSLDTAAEGYEYFDALIEQAKPAELVDIQDDDNAEVLYTSGTTGKPKGCLHSHRNVIQAGITGALAIKLDDRDRLLTAMPVWHSSPLNNWFMGAQYVGATTVPQLSHLMPAPLLISFRASFMVTSIISMISCSEVA